ncbi:hypothetical protein Kpol_1010p37 [Vanderwaltozyma polyspora DSM 70294]|uniref:Peroxisomal membrane protein PEX14-like KPWE domain-containing protein n=1 Tax=Vanderwaltozyma polyspora (strain ATCC 22028 / DSM 70294 / BCRC 21397 / CBS 2163 / NBRC 10782 / NRRL Y-8283 / UCD 57-17) TaxID=436907 RepID=A7TII3_VANPO|nr:uncharacterized protein Kpol_1010p37 [Vanderwaltozyma polyspora DSM 70294]EDO17921.1 hypothetical protein Kpol_1010p37 [Vanderwaltozyma polyspora DSM 70294]
MEEDKVGVQLSYDELVDHIVNNKPVPNVKVIPNITHDESEISKSELKPRGKPWDTTESKTQVRASDKSSVEIEGSDGKQEIKVTEGSEDIENYEEYFKLEEDLATSGNGIKR